jgi:hypothetical protein
VTAAAPAQYTLQDARRAVAKTLGMMADLKAPGLYECTACDIAREAGPAVMCPECEDSAAAASQLAAAVVEVASAKTAEDILAVVITATEGDEL